MNAKKVDQGGLEEIAWPCTGWQTVVSSYYYSLLILLQLLISWYPQSKLALPSLGCGRHSAAVHLLAFNDFVIHKGIFLIMHMLYYIASICMVLSQLFQPYVNIYYSSNVLFPVSAPLRPSWPYHPLNLTFPPCTTMHRTLVFCLQLLE